VTEGGLDDEPTVARVSARSLEAAPGEEPEAVVAEPEPCSLPAVGLDEGEELDGVALEEPAAEPELRSLPRTGLDGEGEDEEGAAVDEPEELAPADGADGFEAPEPLGWATAEVRRAGAPMRRAATAAPVRKRAAFKGTS
jgi:hypothetical protein